MTQEEKFVVDPLVRWFKNQRVQWRIHRPAYATSATGWDIEVRRKNLDLLIEAKYISGPFLSSFTGLVTAPLAKRRQQLMVRKYRSRSYGVCWAIGAEYAMRNIYQILLDYLARNPVFWKHYSKDLRMMYVFFVENGKVTRIQFTTLLRLAEQYSKQVGDCLLRKRRLFAEELMRR